MLNPGGNYNPNNGQFDGPEGFELFHDINRDASKSGKHTKRKSPIKTLFIIIGLICLCIPGWFLLGALILYCVWAFS
ncbi:MAG: hypothetical protein K6F30_08740 [Lachnospiraceae bacterium]|nr:hypothetical protein [Lachnospiraceae bacterium]